MTDLQIYNIPVSEIKVNEKNSKKHSDKQVKAIMHSIDKYGFNDPLGVAGEDNKLIEGHGRLMAARKLGMKEVPCIRLDNLTEEQLREYAVAHNATTLMSGFDMKMLDVELSGLDFDREIFNLKKKAEEEIAPEVEFSENLEEYHDYIVLYFDNEIDWLQAQTLFGLKKVKTHSTRKDGADNGFTKVGVGRVIKGSEALSRLLSQTVLGGDK